MICDRENDLKVSEESRPQNGLLAQSYFQTMLEGACIIEMLFDENGRPIDYRFLETNPAFESQTGLHDAKGKLMRELAPEHEEHGFHTYGKVALTGEPASFVSEAKALNRWFKVSAYRVGSPKTRRVAVHFYDITEMKRTEAALRESEQLYRSLFGNMLNGFAHCRIILQEGRPHDFVYLAVNAAFESLTGLRDVVGRKATDVIPGLREADPQLLAICGRVAASGQAERCEIFLESMQMWFLLSVYRTLPGHFVYLFDVITERKKADQALLDQQQKLMEMAFELQLAEERERARIAGELHDLVGQRLLLGKMKLDMLESRRASGSITGELSAVAGLIEESIQDIRSLTFQLRPPLLANEGLVAAVGWLCSELNDDHGLEVEFSDDQAAKPLDYEFRSLLYQSVRELLLNVIKHAGTKKARVALERTAQTVVITVEDQGAGFDPAKVASRTAKNGGYGLFNLKQKIEYLKGTFVCETSPGKGTRTTLIFPLKQTT
jgi:PAS domain S-box-containing protein